MNFIKKLKTKSIITNALLALLILAMSALFLAGSQFWLLWQKPANLHDVPREDLEGAYVTVELPRIFGSYAYTEEFENDFDSTGTIISEEYIIDANEYDYCGLLIEEADLIAQANELLEQTYAYNDYTIDEITATFTVTGIMKKMPSDSLGFYHEVVGYDNLSPDEQETFLPLYLVVRDGGDQFLTYFLLVFGVIFALWAVLILVKAVSGGYQKQILQKAAQLSPSAPEQVLEQLDRMNEDQPKVKLLMNDRLIFSKNGNASRLYAMNELVWAYHAVTTQRVYFIPVGKTHSLALATLDGKIQQIPMKEAQIKQYLQTIYQTNPNCFVGYSDELAKLFRKNPAAVSQLRAAQESAVQQ